VQGGEGNCPTFSLVAGTAETRRSGAAGPWQIGRVSLCDVCGMIVLARDTSCKAANKDCPLVPVTPPGVTKHGDTDLPGTNPMRSKRLMLIAGVALVALGHRRSAFD
jgi:hypothetical protein